MFCQLTRVSPLLFGEAHAATSAVVRRPHSRSGLGQRWGPLTSWGKGRGWPLVHVRAWFHGGVRGAEASGGILGRDPYGGRISSLPSHGIGRRCEAMRDVLQDGTMKGFPYVHVDVDYRLLCWTVGSYWEVKEVARVRLSKV